MPLYEVSPDRLSPVAVEKFAALDMYEREDLQRLLRDNISPLGDDLLVIAEEFGQWEDARRRVDLLAIDTTGQLVVIELKRSETGGHMDLQAIRYAAMVSTMSFADVVATYQALTATHHPDDDIDARARLLDFLGADEEGRQEPTISTNVRITLVSAGFGREITTTVLWLNSFEGMDIRCFRLVPYQLDGRVMLDVQQVIPLPETADYQVRVRRKEAERERARTRAADTRDLTKYHIVIDGQDLPAMSKRQAIRTMVEQLAVKGVPLQAIHQQMPERGMRRLPGQLRDKQQLLEALIPLVASTSEASRHFTDRPLIDEANNETYVVYQMWGTKTEQVLSNLAAAFPDSGVTFRRAETSAVPTED
jgi:hypothetical protein